MALSLQEKLDSLVAQRATVRLELTSGHNLDLTLTSAGAHWVAGETGTPVSGADDAIGAVIPTESIVCLEDTAEASDNREGLPNSPQHLSAMVSNLVALRKRVSVFGHTRHWSGVVQEAASDHLVLAATTGGSVLVPYVALSWIAVR
jgi:hypothetical protein